MQRRRLPTVFLALTLTLLCWHGDLLALSASEAAEQARSQTGGKVLKVQTKSDGRYRVKVLMPSGQVRSLSIGNSEGENNRRDSDSRNDKQSREK